LEENLAEEEVPKTEASKTQVSKSNGAVSPLVIKLRKPVIANGDEVMELTFREPTAADIDRIGNPVNIDPFSDPPKYTFQSQMMTMMMATLATVPPSTIRQMHPKDWNNGAWMLINFFIPDI
jgi:hypothetical protein